MTENIKTPRTDELAREALHYAIGDMPFNDALKLCEDLEKKLEKKLEMAKFWMAKVNDYSPPRMQDLSRMDQCLQFISSNKESSCPEAAK